MRSLPWRFVLTGLMLVAMTVMLAGEVAAQCATCAAPTVAYYQPAVVQPTVAYKPYTGWYPGKMLDRWRLRRAGVSAPAPAYTAAYSPYTAAYTPYTAAYTPYVSSYAPLSAPAAAPCNTCAQTAYYPAVQTLARPVLMRPVVAPACNTCSYTPACSCGVCDSCCSAGVSQAAYAEPACSSCAGGGSVSSAAPPISYDAPNVGPPTPRPSLAPEPAPEGSSYRSNLPVTEESDADPLDEFDPGPTDEIDPSTYYPAPRLLNPNDDRTALRTSSRKPTVDVWQAVYRKSATASNVSRTSAGRARTQAEIDADGWAPVRRGR